MSDTSTSGSTPSGAPAETASAPAADFGASFGTARGSGLARGKRVSSPASAPAPVSNLGTYTPSAVQIMTAASEYKNPFAPADETPVSEPIPVPARVTVVALPVEASASAPVAPVATFVNPAPVRAIEEKAKLNILPPAELNRPAQSWETPAFPYEGDRASSAPRPTAMAKPVNAAPAPLTPVIGARDERDVFRPVRRSEVPMLDSAPNASGPQERREGRDPRHSRNPRDSRQPRDPREQREPRQPRQHRDPRDYEPKPSTGQLPQPASSAPAPKKAGGVVGWFKGLFAAGAPATDKPVLPGLPGQQPQGQRIGDDNRRRHRGGRGRSGGGGNGGGPQTGTPPTGAPRPEGHNPNHGGQGLHHGQSQGDQGHGGGGGRRRRRGGRGRNGGGQGGGPRPEGGAGPGPAAS